MRPLPAFGAAWQGDFTMRGVQFNNDVNRAQMAREQREQKN